MAFDLLNRFSMNHMNTNNAVTLSGEQSNMSPAEFRNAMRIISSLLPGQSIQGELIQKDGSNIQLLLKNNFILNTKLDHDLNLNMGQLLTFEVKGNQNGQLILRPLFENVGQDANVSKALEAAGLKETQQTVKMVNELMNKGMPVNKDILLDIFKQTTRYPDADVSDIIMLHKMQMPINENNIRQMHLYQNNNQWMVENFTQLTQQMFHLMQDLDIDELQHNTIFQEINEAVKLIYEDLNANDNLDPVNHEMFTDTISGMKEENLPIVQENNGTQNNKVNNLIDLLNQIKGGSEKERELLQNEVIKVLKDEFLLDPQKINQKDYINRYYEKLSNATSKIEELLKETGKGDTAFAKTVTQIKSNVNFINQVNELYHYIQLPLKMNDRHANGELYVFSRKNKPTTGEDNLTALLHLSMDNLGNMDIFLTLKGEHLNTRFCLEKEEMIDFIEQHIDELNNRLSKKGYNTTTQVSKMVTSQSNVIKTILGEEQNTRLLSTQSFDARA